MEYEILQDRKIVEHNDLIVSTAKMDVIPLKIFELAVAHIDTNKPPQDGIVKLSKRNIYKFFDVSPSSRATKLQDSLKKLHKESVFSFNVEEDGNIKHINISPVEYSMWSNDDVVEIGFNNRIMKYLVNLKEQFTQYALSDIAHLKTKNAIVIYRWLNKQYNEYVYYLKHPTSGRTEDYLHDLQNPKIKVDQLRRLTNTMDSYINANGKLRYSDFEKRVIKPALKEINEKTSFEVSFTKEKYGRTVKLIRFHISEKNAVKPEHVVIEADTNQATPQNDMTRLLTVVTHKYTVELLKNEFLTNAMLSDQNRMFDLADRLYPKYDEFVAKYSMNQLEKHIKYVSEHRKPTDDLCQYLITCVESYDKQLVEDAKKPKKAASQKIVQKEKLPDWAKTEQKNPPRDLEKEAILKIKIAEQEKIAAENKRKFQERKRKEAEERRKARKW